MKHLERIVLEWIDSESYYQFRLVVVEVLAFSVTLMLTAMVYKSFHSPIPIKQLDASVEVELIGGNRVLREERRFLGTREESVSFTRKFYKRDDPSSAFLIGGGMITSEEGVFTVLRSQALPSYMTGEWCSHLTATWWPSLSQVEFSTETPDVCFQVP